MHILITGAKGFVGQNLVASLENIRDGKDMVHQIRGCTNPKDLIIYQYDSDSTQKELEYYCSNADFVFNLAGVNRPEKQSEYMEGNFDFTNRLLDTLRRYGNICPIMLSSSIQASLQGRYADSEYGRSKKEGEKLIQDYAKDTEAKVLIYRFPNIFGKWCRPNYNSAVATFCYNVARNLPIHINDRNTELKLVYIDDLVEEMLRALNGEAHCNSDGYCYVPLNYNVTLGFIVDLLKKFKISREEKSIPDMADDFIFKLYSTYISYLPSDEFAIPLNMNIDNRGSFTEILRTNNAGQFSVNIIRPGTIRGNHWHHSKMEKFVVVSGKGLIQLRRIGAEPNGRLFPVIEYHVSGDEIKAVDIPPGYTHNIINEGETDLVTFMWSNECFDLEKPDTFFMNV